MLFSSDLQTIKNQLEAKLSTIRAKTELPSIIFADDLTDFNVYYKAMGSDYSLEKYKADFQSEVDYQSYWLDYVNDSPQQRQQVERRIKVKIALDEVNRLLTISEGLHC